MATGWWGKREIKVEIIQNLQIRVCCMCVHIYTHKRLGVYTVIILPIGNEVMKMCVYLKGWKASHAVIISLKIFQLFCFRYVKLERDLISSHVYLLAAYIKIYVLWWRDVECRRTGRRSFVA